MKKKILIFIDWYLPGYLAGGPIRSIYNFVNLLKEDYDITIVTSNKDLNSSGSYSGMNKSISYGKINGSKVIYLSAYNFMDLIRINLKNFDVVYLNSIFSLKFTFIPLVLKMISNINSLYLISPRGMFHLEALSQKKIKKKIYLKTTKFLFNQKNIIFQASNKYERDQIRLALKFKPKIFILENPVMRPVKKLKNIKIEDKTIRLLYISRICEHKNLLLLIVSLKILCEKIEHRIDFNIYGFIEEKDYWEKCKKEMRKLPESLKITYKGTVESIEKVDIFNKHHFLLLLSKSENFGHIIYESISAGRPVVISKNTPWSILSKIEGGIVTSLDKNIILNSLEKIINLSNSDYTMLCRNALKFSKNIFLKQNYNDNFKFFINS